MWRLVISQKKYTRYTAEGSEKEFATSETTVFDCENINPLLAVVAALSALEPETETEFKIFKVEESEQQ
jgi:hypothetical protein